MATAPPSPDRPASDPAAGASPADGVSPADVGPIAAEGDVSQVEQDRLLINTARAKGRGPLLKSFVKLSGPGWLQSAITLGGGSLAASLYLGVIGGYGLLWLQPLAMMLGIVMLAAIAYVTLSTRRRPFEAIKTEINPALAWCWLIASMLANFVWCLPQYNLATAAIRQNLFSDAFPLPVAVVLVFLLAGTVSWFYESGGRGIKIFEMLLKALVMLVVVSFMVVVIVLLFKGEMPLGSLISGFIPDPSLLTNPGTEFSPLLRVAGEGGDYWRGVIVSKQQEVMITAFATAVGINMTFLLPYSMLARGWDRDFRGLAIFDLSTSLLLPFLLATTCVVVAAATRFHASEAGDAKKLATPLAYQEEQTAAGDTAGAALTKGYIGLIKTRLESLGVEPAGERTEDDGTVVRFYTDEQHATIPSNERRIASSLVNRDAGHLASSLTAVFGRYSNIIFGVGIFAMGVSTIIILMLINGFVFCEMMGQPGNATLHRIGAFAAGIFGMLGPWLFAGDAKLWLAVPTSVFGAVLLPIAYLTFFAMMNSKSLLGDARPTGLTRVVVNLVMGVSCAVALFASLYSVFVLKGGLVAQVGGGVIALIAVSVIATHFAGKSPAATE